MEFYYSDDEEHFSSGPFPTMEDAALEAFCESYRDTVYIGQRKDISPETLIEGYHIIDVLINCEEYSHDSAEDCWNISKDAEKDLTDRLQKMFVEWMDANNTRPNYFLITDVKEVGRPACPCCLSNERVIVSPPESADRGPYFCPCNEPGENPSGHFTPTL